MLLYTQLVARIWFARTTHTEHCKAQCTRKCGCPEHMERPIPHHDIGATALFVRPPLLSFHGTWTIADTCTRHWITVIMWYPDGMFFILMPAQDHFAMPRWYSCVWSSTGKPLTTSEMWHYICMPFRCVPEYIMCRSSSFRTPSLFHASEALTRCKRTLKPDKAQNCISSSLWYACLLDCFKLFARWAASHASDVPQHVQHVQALMCCQTSHLQAVTFKCIIRTAQAFLGNQ